MTNRNDRIQAQAPLRPIGVAFAAVVAGIGVAKAEAAPRLAPSEPLRRTMRMPGCMWLTTPITRISSAMTA